MTSDELRAFIETPHERKLWGTPHMVQPRLCSKVFGDGRQFICISPIMYRPHYFVVRIDSRMGTETGAFHDMLQEEDGIYDAIEHEWGWELAARFDYEEEEAEGSWRVFDDGSCWGTWKPRQIVRDYAEWCRNRTHSTANPD